MKKRAQVEIVEPLRFTHAPYNSTFLAEGSTTQQGIQGFDDQTCDLIGILFSFDQPTGNVDDNYLSIVLAFA